MNLPEYARALEYATAEYEKACSEARDRFMKALAVARQEFFEDDQATMKAVERRDGEMIRDR